jgi:tetratricopeptide (TPR) repeat protein
MPVTVLVADTPPDPGVVARSLPEVGLSDSVSCTEVVAPSDADADDLQSTWAWRYNGLKLPGFDTPALNLLTLDQFVNVTVTPGDDLACERAVAAGGVVALAQSATAAIIDVDVCDTALSPCAAEGTCTETPGLDALIGGARVGTEIAELEDAERAARRAIEGATELGARHHVLAARIQLGAALLLRGDRPEAAAETFEAAVDEADRLGESSQRIYALSQLSMVHARNARLAEAEELARKTLADLDERLDRRGWAGVGRLHSMLGLVCQRSGRFDEAGSQYGPARRAIKRSGDQGAVCMIEISVGNLLYRQDRKEEAAAQFARAAKAAGSIDYRFGEAVARNNLGDVLLQLGRPSDALASLDAAASTFRQLGVDDYEADSMRLTALAQLALGEQDKARETIDKALQLKVDERIKKGIDAASEQICAAVATA